MKERLETTLAAIGPVAIAVSGGVDSMTLGVVAHRLLGLDHVTMLHAISPAVPPEATDRVRRYARNEGWDLALVDAGELSDENYVRNPVNRCFFCKTNLYSTIAGMSQRQILSGTNSDDLGEYRPGLEAARDHGVRHPYVESGIDKQGVRRIAYELGLEDVAELPASPCLSSRVETRISIDPETLRAIHAIERLVDAQLDPQTVRCRVRRSGVVVELDTSSLARVDGETQGELAEQIMALLPATLATRPVSFAPYRNGSAFVAAQT